MDNLQTYYETTASTVIHNLKARQIEGFYCPTAKDAVNKALSFLPEHAIAAFGGSMTLAETGLMDALRKKENLTLLDRDAVSTPEEKNAIFRQSFSSDYYFMSSNAITKDGELVNLDGTGNRVAALIYGPTHVILLAGMNKIVPSLGEAISRVRNLAAPPNAMRLNRNTPCTITGFCGDCQSPDCICSQLVITRRSSIPGRIKVLLIGESLGY